MTPGTRAHQASLSLGFPGKNTGVGCYFILQGIFPTQGLNPHLLHCRWIFLLLFVFIFCFFVVVVLFVLFFLFVLLCVCVCLFIVFCFAGGFLTTELVVK